MSRGAGTILLTGSTGFLGSNLLKALLHSGYKVLITTRNSTNRCRIENELPQVKEYNIESCDITTIFEENSIDAIIHCATSYGTNDKDDIALLHANLILPLTLLKLGIDNNVKCFINTDTVLDKRINCYSLSKSQFRDWLKVYAKQINSINIALEHFYGPHDDESKFVTFIITRLISNIEKIDLTAGDQKRDFIYIDDVVDAFMRIVDNSFNLENGFHHYEIGSGRTVAVRDFVTLVQRLADNSETHLNFGALPYRENEVMESRVDISEVCKLGWFPRVSLEEGLEQTVRMEKLQTKYGIGKG